MRVLRVSPFRMFSSVFQVLRWSRSYDVGKAVGDLIAGITIALTLIPQAIAYASLAGLEPQYGLYASFVGGFIYAVMGTCPQINIGPTALLSLLTFTYTHGMNADFAVLLCLVSGVVIMLAGIMQLGFLVEFVSLPVVSGFTSAAAVTIASSQIKGLLGLKFSAETFMATWRGVFDHIGETRLPDTLLSLICCIILMGMKALKDIRIKKPEDEKKQKGALIMQRVLWFAGVGRNAVVVIMAAAVAFCVYEDKNDPLILTGDITAGLPTPQLPPISTVVGNTTMSTGEMLSHIGTGLFIVPLVGIISNVAIAKAFSNGQTLDATQEIIALGACNLVGAFFRSFPVNGSFTRSAVSDASGVRTPMAGLYTGIIVLVTLALLTPYFFFIPRAALAAVIVCAVLHMVDVAILKRLWRSNRLDLIPLVGTFICALVLGVEIGLVCGVLIDVLLLLYYQSRPPLDVHYIDDGILPAHYAIHPVGGLHFAGAEKVRSKLITIKRSPKIAVPDITQDIPTLTIIPDHMTNDRGIDNNGFVDTEYSNGTRASSTVPYNGFGNSEVNEVNTSRMDRRNSERKPSNVLVVYCDSLFRLDYTFLQSLKMLVSEWSKNGRVIFCEVKPAVESQLKSVITEPLCCNLAQLRGYLVGATFTEENQYGGDTPL